MEIVIAECSAILRLSRWPFRGSRRGQPCNGCPVNRMSDLQSPATQPRGAATVQSLFIEPYSSVERKKFTDDAMAMDT